MVTIFKIITSEKEIILCGGEFQSTIIINSEKKNRTDKDVYVN